MSEPTKTLEYLARIMEYSHPQASETCKAALTEIASMTAQRDALLAACQMSEKYTDDTVTTDEFLAFLRENGWAGEINDAWHFMRDFRRQAIALATKEQP